MKNAPHNVASTERNERPAAPLSQRFAALMHAYQGNNAGLNDLGHFVRLHSEEIFQALRSETAPRLPQEPTHAMLKALAGDPVILAGSDEAELRLRYAAMLAATPACASPNRNVAKRLRQAFADGDWGAVEDIADLLDERLNTDKGQ